jgi:hypothetical protein
MLSCWTRCGRASRGPSRGCRQASTAGPVISDLRRRNGGRSPSADLPVAAARLGRRGWEIRSAGTGSKGQRWYAWAWLGTASARHHLLIPPPDHRRARLHHCYLPEGHLASPARPVRAPGLRWPAEEDFEFGKDCSGLNQSQVRLYTAIARHTMLVMAALAICAVTAALLRRRTGTQPPAPVLPDQPPPADLGMIPLTVPETARVLSHPPHPAAPGTGQTGGARVITP